MIKTIFHNSETPILKDRTIYDYAALESLEEFKELTDRVTVIVLVDKDDPDDYSIVYGLEVLKQMAAGNLPAMNHAVLALAVQMETDEFEKALDQIEAVKGFHEFEESDQPG